MWFVNNIQKIIRWANAVMDSLGNIALGAIAAAVGFIVSAIKTIIPVILDFFARLLNISGIVDAVKKIIDKIAAPIHAAINKVIDWIVGWVKKIFGKGDGKETKKPDDKKSSGKIEDTEVGKNVSFNDGHEEHHLWIVTKGSDVEVMVASVAKTVKERIEIWEDQSKKLPDEEKLHAQKLISLVKENYLGTLADARIARAALVTAEKDQTEANLKDAKQKDTKVESKEESLKNPIAQLFKLFNSNYEISPELKDIVVKLTGLPGAEGLIGYIESKKIVPWFKHGFKTQAERAIVYNKSGHLIAIEYRVEDKVTLKISPALVRGTRNNKIKIVRRGWCFS